MKYGKIDAVADALNCNEDASLVRLHNEMVGVDSPHYIHDMDDFNTFMEGKTPLKIAQIVTESVESGLFDAYNQWFVKTEYGDYASFSFLSSASCPLDLYELAYWLCSEKGSVFIDDYVSEDDLKDSFIGDCLPMDYDTAEKRLEDYKASHEGFTLAHADWDEVIEKLKRC